MSRAVTKTNNDASLLHIKIQLRLQSLPDKTDIKVLDAFGGEGVLWDLVRKAAPDKNIRVLSIDMNKYKKVQLQGDNLKFLASMDLESFDVIDLDAWGSPSNQLDLILKRNYKGIVHCTFIQSLHGGITKNVLLKLGYTDNMIKKCPSLFNKNGTEKFLQYLAVSGIEKVHIFSKNRKNYMYFVA